MSNQKFYDLVFAVNGDVTAIPDVAQGNGSLSYPEGFGFDYERNPASDPSALFLNRQQVNQLFHDIVANIQEYQIAGFPEWTTAAQNGGTPFPYPINAYVRYDTTGAGAWGVFCSLVNNNTAIPGSDATKWATITPGGAIATQAQVNQGNPGDDASVVGPIELVKAAREGRWWFAGAVTYATTTALTVALPGTGTYSQVAGARVSFTVATANTAAGLTLALGPNAAAPLQSATGLPLQIGDLATGTVYTATFDGVNWRLSSPVVSELQRYGSQGNGSLYGLTTSNAAGALTTAINVAVGACRDSTNAVTISLIAPLTKSLTAAWAAGSGNGGRDTGAIAASQSWHVYVILNPTTNVVDALFSQSATSPTLPAGFTFFRRIGAFLLDATSAIRQYVQKGDWFGLVTRTTDYSAQANGAGPFLRKVSVPNGIAVKAKFYFQSQGSADQNTYHSGLYDPANGVPAAFGTPTQWSQIVRVALWTNIAGTFQANSFLRIVTEQWTDTAQNVYTFSDDAADQIVLGVIGWEDQRGKFF